MALSERLNTPISTAELERRWKAVRDAMARAKIDVLLMQNNNDHMGGYVRYFTDMPATNGYPNTVVFPRDDEMTVVCQGPFGGGETTAQGDGKWRGVKSILTTPSYASCYYTNDYDPALAAKALMPFAKGTIGVLGAYQMSYAMLDTSSAHFPPPTLSMPLTWSTGSRSSRARKRWSWSSARRDAGRRHGCGLCRDQARHARHRSRRDRAGLQRVARQRERHLSLRLDAARPADSSATSTCRTASSKKAISSCCWSRTTGRAACIPNSAVPASSAPKYRRR